VAQASDGPLAPIVADPSKASPHRESVSALRALAGLTGTTAAVISGRALRDLAALSRLPVEVQLIGSHGSEFDIGFVHAIDADAEQLLRGVQTTLGEISATQPGTTAEVQPARVRLRGRERACPAPA